MSDLPEAAPAGPKRLHKRGGWPKGVSKQEMIARKTAQDFKEEEQLLEAKRKLPYRMATHTLEPSLATPIESPSIVPDVVPVEVKPKPPKSERHALRPVSEYPADDMQGGMHHIERCDFPQGYDLQWLGVAVWGQPLNFVIADFTRKGWEPVYPEDFDGKFAYMVPPKWEGPIVIQDLMLVARSMAWSEVARKRQQREAEGQVNVKVGQLRRGELEGVSLNPQHKHLEKTNQINVSLDQVRRPASIPEIED